MAVNVPGLISIIVFYVVILLVGVWAARKSGLRARDLDRQEVMLAGRNIGLCLGADVMHTWRRLETVAGSQIRRSAS
nr:hypothetical protein BaRGS_012269 [Batillaria attramentaria]